MEGVLAEGKKGVGGACRTWGSIVVRRLASSSGPLFCGVSTSFFVVPSTRPREDAKASADCDSEEIHKPSSFTAVCCAVSGITRLSFKDGSCSVCFPIVAAFLRRTLRVFFAGTAGGLGTNADGLVISGVDIDVGIDWAEVEGDVEVAVDAGEVEVVGPPPDGRGNMDNRFVRLADWRYTGAGIWPLSSALDIDDARIPLGVKLKGLTSCCLGGRGNRPSPGWVDP